MSKWKRYEFEQFDQLKGVSGCYVVYAIDQNDPHRIIYIGQSIDIHNRLLGHGFVINRYSSSISCPWGTYGNVYIKVRQSDKFGDWAMIEIRLLKRIKPEGNKKMIGRTKP